LFIKDLKNFRKELVAMKKILIPALVLAMILSAGAAFAKGKAHKAHVSAKGGTVECALDGKKFMTATLDECMHKGGTVTNFPGPNGSAPTPAPEKQHAKKMHHKRHHKAKTAE